MLLVDARAGISKIHGIGLFAYDFIPKGTIVWQFNPEFDVVFTEEQMQALPPPAQRQARRYSYFDPDMRVYVLASDDSRFANHANEPNLLDDGPTNYAARDIQIGEELTCDYRAWGDAEFIE